MSKLKIYYNYVCPNCGGRISSEELEKGLPCKEDYPLDKGTLEEVYEYLKKTGKLKNWKEIYETYKALEEYTKFFESLVNNPPWSAQKSWFVRLYKGYSFSIVAPTGMGKTTFAIVTSLWAAKQNKKTYIVLPTTTLVKQVYEKTLNLAEKAGLDLDYIVAYIGSTKQKKLAKEKIINGEFNILITSNQFLSRDFEILKGKTFDYIFVDDVDAIMKASKNIDRILMLLGFSEETINFAWEIIKLKLQIAKTRKQEELQKLLEELNKKEKELEDRIKKEKKGVLVASSATGSTRGLRVRLFRELLGFEVGAAKTTIRNIIDVYTELKDPFKQTLDLVNKLGSGGLVFVAQDYGSELAEKIAEFLKDNNIKAEAAISGKKNASEILDLYAKGELDVLVGVAHYYGLIVRGIDLPHIVKYAIFIGVPRFRFSANEKETKPGRIITLASILEDYADEEFKKALNQLRRYMKMLSQGSLQMVSEALEKGTKLEGFLGKVVELLEYLRDRSFELLQKEEILKKLEENPFISLKRENNIVYIYIPDVKTYIQASGRTSRMYPGGVTKGLSIILSDDEKLLKGLKFKLKLIGAISEESAPARDHH